MNDFFGGFREWEQCIPDKKKPSLSFFLTDYLFKVT